MLRRNLLAFFVYFVMAPFANGSGETLKEALGKAYLSNPTLKVARAKLRTKDEELSEAMSGWRPEVTFKYDLEKSKIDPGSGTQNRTPRTASIKVKQNLFNGWRTKLSVQKAEETVLGERAELVSTEQKVLLGAGTAYLNLIRDEAVLNLNKSNERVLRRQLEATKDRFEVGEVTVTDVALAESRFSRAIAEGIKAQGILSISRAVYRNIMGELPSKLSAAEPLSGLPSSQEEAINLAKANNPEIQRAIYNERASKVAIKNTEGELYPSIDLEGEVSRRDQTTSETNTAEEASIKATLSIPLYQSGAVSARVRSAKASWNRERRNLEAVIRSTVQGTSQSWERYVTAKAQVNAFSSAVRAAEIALEGVKQEAKVGSRTVLDVLDAEQELMDARVNLIRSQRNTTVASMELRQSLGTLTASKLKLDVKLYNPKKYYNRARNRWLGTSIMHE